jgi:hypothetical protein
VPNPVDHGDILRAPVPAVVSPDAFRPHEVSACVSVSDKYPPSRDTLHVEVSGSCNGMVVLVSCNQSGG